jgi:putative MATE family efflux protein
MRSEWKSLLKLAWPILGASLSQLVLGITNTFYLGRLGESSLASIATAIPIYSILLQGLFAAVMGHQIIAARQFGAGDKDHVRLSFVNSGAILLLLGGASVAISWFSAPIASLISGDPTVVNGAIQYLRYRSPSLVLASTGFLIQRTFDTKLQTKWGLYSSLLSNILNIPLNYALIFGIATIPAMGIAGAGLGDTLASLSGMLLLATLFVKLRPIPLRPIILQWNEIRELLRLSGPEIINSVLDYSGGFVFAIVVGVLGTASLAGSRISYQFLIILFTIATSFGVGIQILIGRNYGKKDFAGMMNHLREGRNFLVWILAASAVCLAVLSGQIARFFTSSQPVISAAIPALIVVAISTPLMAPTVAYVAGLRAVGRTKWVMYSNLGATWFVELPTSWLFGIVLGLGLAGVYAGYATYFIARAVAGRYLANRAMNETEAKLLSVRAIVPSQ